MCRVHTACSHCHHGAARPDSESPPHLASGFAYRGGYSMNHLLFIAIAVTQYVIGQFCQLLQIMPILNFFCLSISAIPNSIIRRSDILGPRLQCGPRRDISQQYPIRHSQLHQGIHSIHFHHAKHLIVATSTKQGLHHPPNERNHRPQLLQCKSRRHDAIRYLQMGTERRHHHPYRRPVHHLGFDIRKRLHQGGFERQQPHVH